MKMELRTSNVELNSDGNLVVSGYVNKTGELSELLGTTKKFREKIMPGAFKKAIENRSTEIEFLAEHDNSKVLASTRNGSLELREDEQGLFMSATIVPTSYGKDFYELIRSGIIKSMSFGFRAIKDAWTKMNGEIIRSVEELQLFEVSAVKNPAYVQSNIQARSIDLVQVQVPDKISEFSNNLKGEKDKMAELKKMEQRNTEFGLNEMIREERALQTTTNGAALIPEQVANQIVLKMQESSPIFAMATKVDSVNGYLKVAKETDFAAGTFIGEGTDLVEGALNLGEVKLEQKRVGAAISVSQQLINDSAVNLDAYVGNLLGRRVAKAVEKSMLLGSTTEEFKGIFNDAEITVVDTATANTVVMDDLVGLTLSIHPDFLSNACFVMSRPFFNMVAKMKDTDGHYYVQNGIVNGKLTYMLFGFPCYVSDAIVSTQYPVIFGNITEAYTIMIKKGFGLQRVSGDTATALKGSVLYVFDAYLDGAIVNNQAIAKLNVKLA